MTVLALIVAIIGCGVALRLPAVVTGAMLALLWFGILLAHLVLPPDNPVNVATGGSWQGWLALGGAAAVLFGYRAGLRWLRGKAAPVQKAAPTAAFSEAELDRYARHIVLREVGGTGQKRLKAARVLVVGAGGLGSPALLYLAAAGVGTIGVIDDDTVSNSNLQRQVIHKDADIGKPKVFSAEAAIGALNPFVAVRPYHRRLTEAEAPVLFADYDLILDGSDNFATRHLVNAAAVKAGKPLVAAAITQWEGQISLYHPQAGAPCYACVFPVIPEAGLAPTCADAGVMGALPGVMGAMMAAEAIKHITGAGQTLAGRMLLYDALYGENRVVTLQRRADCAVCGGH
ncbi:MAG: HesA/MoeB/ThiF family protein [Rhodobacteraceae bacterium]|nr:HesA/MoeB/ThiF family protein [Paracoccaceae bacterium]